MVGMEAGHPPQELPEQDREEVGFGFEVESPPEAGPRRRRWQESFPSVIRITKGKADNQGEKKQTLRKSVEVMIKQAQKD